jgi:hypothetical protein
VAIAFATTLKHQALRIVNRFAVGNSRPHFCKIRKADYSFRPDDSCCDSLSVVFCPEAFSLGVVRCRDDFALHPR